MTREEAARVLKYLWIERDENAKLMQQLTTRFFERQEALRIGVAALRSPTPDPDTGLVPCGCGCKPELRDDGWGWHQVYCTGCDMHGGNSHTPDGVIEEWNTAMGYTALNGDEGAES